MGEFSIAYSVPGQHLCYQDHFPARPVVPGALLLEWICQYLMQQVPDRRVTGIPFFKFLHPVFPEDLLQLHFHVSDDVASARVACLRMDNVSGETELVAKGKLSLGVKT
jgi:3-hydroxymyristoyl/3-hydroxydecanoyl-(acyl carrier protein) dehydratase